MRETAIRAAIGCGRTRLVRQFLTESLLMSLAGSLGGLALAIVAVRLFDAWNPLGMLPANAIQVNARAVIAAGIAMGVTTIVAGVVPALRVSKADPQDALRSSGGHSTAAAPAQRTQLTMLVAQMTVCVMLLAATALITQTFIRLQSEPLGFQANDLFVANVVLPGDAFDTSAKRNAYCDAVANVLLRLPQVTAVAAGTSRPLNSGAPATVRTSVEDSAKAPRISAQAVTSEFFETLGITLVAGRLFDERDTAAGAPVLIVNARAAQDLFGTTANAIGRRVRLDDESWREVVGVVGNVRSTFFNTLEWKMDPIVYRPARQAFTALSNPTATSFGLSLHIRADHLTIGEARRAVASADPRTALTELRTVSELVHEATRQPAFRMRLLLGFAAISVLLAAIGTYGLVSQAIAQRLKEIAIRMALGASSGTIVTSITRRAVAAASVGVVAGSVAALVAGRALEAMIYGVRADDALSFAAAAATLFVVAAVAALIPALRAAGLDPTTILRAD